MSRAGICDNASGPELMMTSQQPPESPAIGSMLSRVGHGTVWVAIGRFADIGAVVVANMLLARWLDPEAFKSFLVLFNVASLLSICGTLGFNRSIVRFVAESLAVGGPERADRLLTTAFRATGIGALAAAGGMVVVVLWFEESPSWRLAVGMSAIVVVRAAQRLATEALRGYHEIRAASLFAGQNAGQASGPLADIVFLALAAISYLYLTPSLIVAVLLNLAALLVVSPLLGWSLRQARRTPKTSTVLSANAADDRLPAPTTRHLISVSVATLVTQVFIFTTWHSDLWLAELTLLEVEAALYAGARTAVTTVMLPLSLVNLAVVSSIPTLHARGHRDRLQSLLRTTATFAAAPTLAAIALLIVAGRYVLLIMFGEPYMAGSGLLAILVVGRLVSATSGAAGFALMMTGHERTHLAISLGATLLLWTLGPIGAARFGPQGLAVASAGVFSAHHLAIWWAVRRRLGVWSHATWSLDSLRLK